MLCVRKQLPFGLGKDLKDDRDRDGFLGEQIQAR
jgi:hypothetical protein